MHLHRPFPHVCCCMRIMQGVREVSELDQSDIEAYPWDEEAERAALGVVGWHGEAGYSTLEQR